MKKHLRTFGLLFLLLLLPAILLPALSITAAAEEDTCQVTVMIQLGDNPPQAALRKDDKGNANYSINSTQIADASKPNVYTFPKNDKLWIEWLSAIPGYQFDHWELTSSDPTTEVPDSYYSMTLSHGYTFIARFEVQKYTLKYTAALSESDIGKPDHPSIQLESGYEKSHTYGTEVTLAKLATSVETHKFVAWNLYLEGETDESRVLDTRAAGATIGANEYPHNLVLVPKWEPKSFSVTRHDVYIKADGTFGELGTYTGEAEFNTVISAKTFGGDKSYRGYAGIYTEMTDSYKDNAATPSQITVSASADANHVYRIYKPNSYTIQYAGFDSVPDAWKKTHTYGTDTALPIPDWTTGEKFVGWEIVRAAGDDWISEPLKQNADGSWTLLGDAFDGNGTLTLQPKAYAVSCDESTLYGNTPALPTTCAFADWLEISASAYPMAREGYTFLGWRIAGSDDAYAVPFLVAAKSRVEDLTLEAGWQPNEYTLVFASGNGDYTPYDRGTESLTVVFDGSLSSIRVPACEGFDFLGYWDGDTPCYDADGTPVLDAWTVASDRTLAARWKIQEYPLEIRVQDSNGANLSNCVTVSISVNGGEAEPYDPARLYAYDSKLTVSVAVKDAYRGRLIACGDTALAYARSETLALTVGAEDQALSFVLLPIDPKPVLIALIALIALQLIAIFALLIGRGRRKRYHVYSAAIFAFPAIRGDILAVVVLAAVAAILQIILIILIAKSAPVRKAPRTKALRTKKPHSKKARPAAPSVDSAPADPAPAGSAGFTGFSPAEDSFASWEDELVEEPEFFSNDEELPTDGASDAENADDALLRDRFSAVTEGEESFDEDNFIEPSANPTYSLPEE